MSKQVKTMSLDEKFNAMMSLVLEIQANQAKMMQGQVVSKPRKQREIIEFVGKTKAVRELNKLKGVKVQEVGTYIWVSGKTKENASAIKALGFKYAPKKQMWYANTESKVSTSKKVDGKYVSTSFKDLQTMYGKAKTVGTAKKSK